MVDAKDKANLDPDYQLQPEDLHDWEQKNGPITPDCILLINFGWAQKYPTAADYFGSPSNDPATFHFPGTLEYSKQYDNVSLRLNFRNFPKYLQVAS